jgi:protein-S-isoprenylcysteine O-methyltransferase Ste14
VPGYLFPKAYADLAARLRVPSGFVLVIVFIWLSKPTVEALIWGFPVSAVGLLLRGWAAGHLAKNQRLVNTGPYARMRNPLYLGTLLVAAGLVIAAREWILAVVFGTVFLGVYLPVIQEEEKHLRDLFPEFEKYARSVPLLYPRLKPVARGRFQWALYRKNEEYNALLGFLVGEALLAAKALWV